MYFVADQVMERAAGQPWQDFVERRICQPLGMGATTFSVSGIPADRLALRHWRSDDGIVPRPPGTTGGGIYSTVLDLASFIKLQLAQGQFAGQQVLSQSAVREMHAMQYSIPILNRPHGQHLRCPLHRPRPRLAGPRLSRPQGRPPRWLVGASVTMIPEENLGVVVLNNIDIEGIAGMLSYDVLDAFLVGPQLAWDQAKWESTWLTLEGPGYPYRPRTRPGQLEQYRITGTSPLRPLDDYAGTYQSPLFGDVVVTHNNGQLLLDFAGFKTSADTLAPRSVLRPLPHPHHVRLVADIFSAAREPNLNFGSQARRLGQ